VSDQQYITILSALGDIQSAVDAIGLDVERLCEDVLDEPEVAARDLDPPPWVNDPHKRRVVRSSAMGELRQMHAKDVGGSNLPPPRGNPGSAVGLVVTCALVAVVSAVLILWLLS